MIVHTPPKPVIDLAPNLTDDPQLFLRGERRIYLPAGGRRAGLCCNDRGRHIAEMYRKTYSLAG